MYSFIHSFIHYHISTSPYRCFYLTHATRALESHVLSGEGINYGSHTLLTTQGHGGPLRMSDKLNVGATSETTRTWKTIHTIHSNKANMKGWLWWPSDIRGPCGPKDSWHLSYRWRKNPKKPPRKPVSTGDWTRACCVTGAPAIACSTAVDYKIRLFIYLFVYLFIYLYLSSQEAQAARHLVTGGTIRVLSWVAEGWRYFLNPSCRDWSRDSCKMSTGVFRDEDGRA